MATVVAIAGCFVVFLIADTFGWWMLVNRMSRTEQAIITVLQYVVAHHGEQMPPHVAALFPTSGRGAHRG
jgi:hypothetical protein